jgi:hypothetical protein
LNGASALKNVDPDWTVVKEPSIIAEKLEECVGIRLGIKLHLAFFDYLEICLQKTVFDV